MKRKLLSTILAIIGITVIGFSVLYFLGLFKEQDAGILIESDPTSTVFIDGLEVGVTPYEAKIRPREIVVKIKPEQNGQDILDDYETKVNLTPGIKTIIKRSFKPNDLDSSGAVVSFEKVGGDSSYVTVVSIPDNSEVLIDDKIYGFTPLRVETTAGDHSLVVRANGYDEESLPIRVYKGFKLTAAVKLAKLELPAPEPTSTTTDVTELNETITINETDIGFLRVREGPGTQYSQIGMVKAGEVYDILESDNTKSWYQIEFGDPKIKGWVSKEFVKKN